MNTNTTPNPAADPLLWTILATMREWEQETGAAPMADELIEALSTEGTA